MATKFGLCEYFRSDTTWGQKSSRGQSALQIPYGYQIWWEEPLTRVYCIAGVKGHVRVIWGQPGVKLLRNALQPPNLVGRIPDQSVKHCWGQRSCRVSWGQVGVNLLSNAHWPPNLVGRIPDQGAMHCWSRMSWRGHLGSTRGQID